MYYLDENANIGQIIMQAHALCPDPYFFNFDIYTAPHKLKFQFTGCSCHPLDPNPTKIITTDSLRVFIFAIDDWLNKHIQREEEKKND